MSDKENLELISLNGNGLRDDRKRRSLFSWLKHNHRAKDTFIFLQETHTTPKLEKLWEKDWGNKILFAHGNSGSKGVAILLPININFTIANVTSDNDGRYIVLAL